MNLVIINRMDDLIKNSNVNNYFLMSEETYDMYETEVLELRILNKIIKFSDYNEIDIIIKKIKGFYLELV